MLFKEHKLYHLESFLCTAVKQKSELLSHMFLLVFPLQLHSYTMVLQETLSPGFLVIFFFNKDFNLLIPLKTPQEMSL